MLEIGAVVTNGVMEAASQKSGDGTVSYTHLRAHET